MSWYNRIIPTIKEIEPLLEKSSQKIHSLPGVKEIMAWGTYAENIHHKETPIREIELLVKCSFDSGDLLSIEKGPMGPFNIPFNELEEEGFNPQAVKFTKGLVKCCEFNADFWCMSSDNKLLHWGPVSDTIEEWKTVRKNAEDKAEHKTGFSRKNLKNSTQEEAKEWIKIYENTLRLFVNKGPLGWYQASSSNNGSLPEPYIKLL